MIKITGVNKYIRKTQAQKARITRGAENFVRASTRKLLRDLVLNAPQWSGDLAASWRINLNYLPADPAPSGLYTEDWENLENVSFKGDRRAWQEALRLNAGHLAAIKYNSIITIVNVKPLAEDLVVATSGSDFGLRPGNYIDGDLLAVSTVALKYRVFSNQLGLQTKSIMDYA